MRRLLLVLTLMLGSAAWADPVVKSSPMSVAETVDGLVLAVQSAGATVFARVDHSAGARSVGETLPPAEVLIFGNPALGTQAMQQDLRAGLLLPLRVLVYEDAEGQTYITYSPAADLFAGLAVSDAVQARVDAALNGLTDRAMSLN